MKHTPESVREQISALADSQLQGEAFGKAMDFLATDGESQSTWQTYQLIGDVLRAGRPTACSDSTAFLARFQQRLAAEEPVQRAAVVAAPVVALPVSARLPVEAANEPIFRWKLVAGAASLVAAAAIGWNWVGGGVGVAPAGAQMAQQQQTAPSVQLATSEGSVLSVAQQGASAGPTRVVVGSGTGNPQVMLRDPRLDQLLEAHRQAAGGAQMPSGFLRNATFESSER